MFASQAQLHAAICKLLEPVHGERFWDASGPLEPVNEYKSSSQRVLVQAAHAIYLGIHNATISAALAYLDANNQRALWSLLLAMVDGQEAIQRWIDGGPANAEEKR